MGKPSFVAFVPGLQGNGTPIQQPPATNEEPLPGTNAHAAWQLAQAVKIDFHQVAYQTPDNPFPTLSAMGGMTSANLIELQLSHMGAGHGEDGIVIASSVGAGVLLQALFNHAGKPCSFKPTKIILLKGVFDPLSAIDEQAKKVPGGNILLAGIRNGSGATFPLPVEPTPNNQKPGVFPIQQHHLMDPKAILPLGTLSAKRQEFIDAFRDCQIPELHLVTADNDHLSSPEINEKFRTAVGSKIAQTCTMHVLSGNHAQTDNRALSQKLTALVMSA